MSLRGVPSGLLASKVSSPAKPVVRAISRATSAMEHGPCRCIDSTICRRTGERNAFHAFVEMIRMRAGRGIGDIMVDSFGKSAILSIQTFDWSARVTRTLARFLQRRSKATR